MHTARCPHHQHGTTPQSQQGRVPPAHRLCDAQNTSRRCHPFMIEHNPNGALCTSPTALTCFCVAAVSKSPTRAARRPLLLPRRQRCRPQPRAAGAAAAGYEQAVAAVAAVGAHPCQVTPSCCCCCGSSGHAVSSRGSGGWRGTPTTTSCCCCCGPCRARPSGGFCVVINVKHTLVVGIILSLPPRRQRGRQRLQGCRIASCCCCRHLSAHRRRCLAAAAAAAAKAHATRAVHEVGG
jgi:hypothetical protein